LSTSLAPVFARFLDISNTLLLYRTEHQSGQYDASRRRGAARIEADWHEGLMAKSRYSHYFKSFAPGIWRELILALVASLALWAIILLYLANHQGLQVFRYVMF
jgi:hypothetical protein